MDNYKIGNYDMKLIQNVLLEILLEIDRVCKIYGIHYSLCYGTLLGAVRHKGFIPWDDDLDIAMLRPEYDKFTKVCQSAFKKRFFLVDASTEEAYPYDFAKVVKEQTVYLERGAEYKNIHKGIYVDIFPLDNVKQSTIKIQHYAFSFFRRARWYAIDKAAMPKDVWKASRTREVAWFTAPLAMLGNRRLHKILETIMRVYNRRETELVYKIFHPSMSPPYKREWFEKTIDLEFEGYRFPCCAGYEIFLQNTYGNYLEYPPKEWQKPSHDIVEVYIPLDYE